MMINVSPFDRALRAAFGLALLASPILGFAIVPLNFLGLVPLISGLVGYCPLYAVLGTSTCGRDAYMHRKDFVVRKGNEGSGGVPHGRAAR